ncbi:hypothetical protein [Pyrococcus yayanosii]|nr:hypothetical protein [Pyrococcus yayanosii]
MDVMISRGEIASYLAIAMGIVYLIVDLGSKRLALADRIFMTLLSMSLCLEVKKRNEERPT